MNKKKDLKKKSNKLSNYKERKYTSEIIGVLLLFALFILPSVSHAYTNLIQNPDFKLARPGNATQPLNWFYGITIGDNTNNNDQVIWDTTRAFRNGLNGLVLTDQWGNSGGNDYVGSVAFNFTAADLNDQFNQTLEYDIEWTGSGGPDTVSLAASAGQQGPNTDLDNSGNCAGNVCGVYPISPGRYHVVDYFSFDNTAGTTSRMLLYEAAISNTFNHTYRFVNWFNDFVPGVYIQQPQGTYPVGNTSFNLTFNVLTPGISINNCFYSVDGGTNTPIASCNNFTNFINVSFGSHLINVCANNSNGVVGCSNQSFTAVATPTPIQFYTVNNIPVSGAIGIDLDTGDIQINTTNASTDIVVTNINTYATINGARANHFYGNNSIDIRNAFLQIPDQFNATNPAVRRFGFSNAPNVFQPSENITNNIWAAFTSRSKYALFIPVLNNFTGDITTFNITIEWQSNGTTQFTNTIPKTFNGNYNYLTNGIMTSYDIINGYAYDLFSNDFHFANYTDFEIQSTGTTLGGDYRIVNGGTGQVTASLVPGSFVSANCFNSSLTYSSSISPFVSGQIVCVRTGGNTYKFMYDTSSFSAQSICAAPSALQGKVETSGASFVKFSFQTQTYTVDNSSAPCDFLYATGSNTIGTCNNITERFYDRNYVNGQIRNDRSADAAVLPVFNQVSCDLVGPYAPAFETGIDQPVIGGADNPYPQDTFCFNLTGVLSTCSVDPTFGAIRVLRTGTYCLGTLNCPSVFDFYWKIYTVTSNFTFGPTSFTPDPTTASQSLLLNWNTSRPGIPAIIYNIKLSDGSTTANTTINSPPGAVASTNNSLAFVANANSNLQSGFYTYWLIASTVGGTFESDMRNFTIGAQVSPPGNLPNQGSGGLQGTGLCDNESCGWIFSFLLMLLLVGLAWAIGGKEGGSGQKFAVSVFLVTSILMTGYNALPFYIGVPLIVLAIVLVVRVFRGSIAGTG